MSFNNNNNMPISYFIEEIEINENNKVEDLILDDFFVPAERLEINSPKTVLIAEKDDDMFNTHIINYQEQFTVKDLLLICEYYKLNVKKKGYIKDVIIEVLVSFELDPKNSDMVSKRQTAWFFMNELKNDKFMRSYVTSLNFRM